MYEKRIREIQQILRNWYEINKRNLPWRETNDPYEIWISEIILQQTRVNQGYDYYLRFVERFPNIKSLASADEEDVLKIWQGLGYYTRARNLHKAAKLILKDFSGEFPNQFENILKLPGIGSYTASAICSFAFHQNYAVLDGNVFRVLARLNGIFTPIDSSEGQKEFSQLAKVFLDKSHSNIHNQAIMEFGAMQCVPNNPDCENCPLNNFCEAFKQHIVELLPTKKNKTKVSNRYFNYFFVLKDDFTFLQKRTKKDIWQNLYEFPLIETTEKMELIDLMLTEKYHDIFENISNIQFKNQIFETKHTLSHQIIFACFYTIIIDNENNSFQAMKKIKIDELDSIAVSKLTENFLTQLSEKIF